MRCFRLCMMINSNELRTFVSVWVILIRLQGHVGVTKVELPVCVFSVSSYPVQSTPQMMVPQNDCLDLGMYSKELIDAFFKWAKSFELCMMTTFPELRLYVDNRRLISRNTFVPVSVVFIKFQEQCFCKHWNKSCVFCSGSSLVMFRFCTGVI